MPTRPRSSNRRTTTSPAAASTPRAASAKPWEHAKQGEGSAQDPLAARFVESLSYDTRLYSVDIRGSLAHARMLATSKLISQSDYAAIERGLAMIQREIESAPAGPLAVGVSGAWPGWKTELEDVHMCIESALIQLIGEPGRKLHTGRSRNDQVALDLRLWIRESIATLDEALTQVLEAFVHIASAQGDTLIPTYTHMQRAQPAVVGAECMAWWSMLSRDRALLSALASVPDGLSASPLGSGAVAGSTLPLNRTQTALDLGFAGSSLSSIDSTASRDEALDLLYALTRISIHLSRWAEQWILYCSTEFGFLALASEFTTGSSMMPQKRNPDMLELIRGRSGNVLGNLVSLLTIVKGLPLAYNRDLQEDKRLLFMAFDTVFDALSIASKIVKTAQFQPARIASTLDRGFLDATVLAELLVQRGVPFRTAHQVVGRLVRVCESSKRHALVQLDLEELREALSALGQSHIVIDASIFEQLGAAGTVRAYQSQGHAGTGPGGYRSWLQSSGNDGPATSSKPVVSSAPTTRAKTSAPASSFINKSAFVDREAQATRMAAQPVAPLPSPVPLFDDDPPQPKSSSSDQWQDVIGAYQSSGRTLDDLPYTPEFDALFASISPSRPGLDKRTLFRRLHVLRKSSKLSTSGKAATKPVKILPEEEAFLQQSVVAIVGNLGKRDQLPYHPQFEDLVQSFNQRIGRSLTPHAVWRVIAKLAK